VQSISSSSRTTRPGIAGVSVVQVGDAVQNFVEAEGINHQWSLAHVLQQNGRAGRVRGGSSRDDGKTPFEARIQAERCAFAHI